MSFTCCCTNQCQACGQCCAVSCEHRFARVPPHLFATPQVRVSPRRVLDVPDEPGAVGQDFPGAVS